MRAAKSSALMNLVALEGLAGMTESAALVGDAAVTIGGKEKHLRFPADCQVGDLFSGHRISHFVRSLGSDQLRTRITPSLTRRPLR